MLYLTHLKLKKELVSSLQWTCRSLESCSVNVIDFTSRINLSFNTEVQRFTRLHGITKPVRDFRVFRRQRNRVFPIKKCLFCFSGEQEAWCGLCQGETSGRLYFKIMSDGFPWTEVHSSSSSGDSWCSGLICILASFLQVLLGMWCFSHLVKSQ